MKKALEACDITEALIGNTDYVRAGMDTEALESFHSTERQHQMGKKNTVCLFGWLVFDTGMNEEVVDIMSQK